MLNNPEELSTAETDCQLKQKADDLRTDELKAKE